MNEPWNLGDRKSSFSAVYGWRLDCPPDRGVSRNRVLFHGCLCHAPRPRPRNFAIRAIHPSQRIKSCYPSQESSGPLGSRWSVHKFQRFHRPFGTSHHTPRTRICSSPRHWNTYSVRCWMLVFASISLPSHVDARDLSSLADPERLRKMLLAPVREVSVELELLKDSGEVDTFKAVRFVNS